jgi:serine/threonine protein phosphatase PrpC
METVETVWNAIRKEGSMHEKAGKAVDSLISESMRRRSSDNLTAILICFR